ncbi:PREDICTED: protein argonaute 2-like [Lipotes vexillifer]|uniref:Protein argonaute 2-like n=1 Tax=Lipotes vexillifer TaxID=118797 RepID=A0A340Y7D7_LIPVE|nr:PREDICTED: protein argonaute 2-like [Lipotes vexillifer]
MWEVGASLFRGFLSPLACPDLIKRESTALWNVPGEGGRLLPEEACGCWRAPGGGHTGRCRARDGRGTREAGVRGDGRARGLRRAGGAGSEAAGAAGRARGSLPGRRRRPDRTGYCAQAVKRARGAGGRKGWRCEGRRAGTGAPRCRCNKNASHGTAHGEGRDRDAAARGRGKSGGGRPGGGGGGGGGGEGGREVKGLSKFSGCCGRRAPG